MSREDLAKRSNWQKFSQERGQSSERLFYVIFKMHFGKKEEYRIVERPKDLKNIYAEKHGIVPDFSIEKILTGKKIFVEIKRQKPEGNAHERACRYFAPGLVNVAREIGKISEQYFPFWILFSNGLAKSEKYRREITFWFKNYEDSLTLWADLTNYDQITKHFEQHIKKRLS